MDTPDVLDVAIVGRGPGCKAIIDMKRCVLENEGKDSPWKTGSSALSRREIEILAHVAVGFENQEIAEKLCTSPHMVTIHLYNVYKKINVSDRLQAILWAAKNL
jgi:DNA-binding CsgD family transcriptional regulator